MSVTEKVHAGEFVMSIDSHVYSMENVTIVSGQNLKAGQVVGKITSGGKYAAYANGAGDGTEVAAGVLWDAVDASSADKAGAVIVRGEVVLNGSLLDWGANDASGITAGKADLKALSPPIIIR